MKEARTMSVPFRDRVEAGRHLANALTAYQDRADVIVLGLPRGGVPVAFEVATILNAPLDVFLVRKLGVPGHEELAMGAIASGDTRVLNDEVIHEWRIPEGAIETVTSFERRELARRERLYRGTREPPNVRGNVVILVDDGLATGSTMRAAVAALRRLDPARIVVAVPVAAAPVCEVFAHLADEMVCAATPEPFHAVGLWYEDFSATTDDEVRRLLREADERGGKRPDAARDPLRDALRASAVELTGEIRDDQPLIGLIGDARFVLIGEATHGTEEFYRRRAALTKRLIEERGFSAVAVEGDWPDAFRVNRYVRGQSEDSSPEEALRGFARFPQWMWRNTVVRDFAGWLRAYNDAAAADGNAVGFYGLDLYSLHRSIEAVVDYLDRIDPEAAQRARVRYSCFDHFGDDAQAYGYLTSLGTAEPCEDEVVGQLLDLRRREAELALGDGHAAADEFFSAEQNARLARNAEAYYRSMFRGRVASWNLRDRHMAETLDALARHLDRPGHPSRIVVWAHNSHIGDARATAMGHEGEFNLGQLARQHHGRDAVLVGFSTYQGTVTAAADWGAPAARRRVRPGLSGSWEALFHEFEMPAFLLRLADDGASIPALRETRLERAIGVIYRPESERFSHYFHARPADQFDALIHIDETHALEPLERTADWEAGEVPATFPSAA
jgi:erythromycin esterase-like protein/predicted phosphoribosyltransferase